MKIIPEPLSFEWDQGNIDKNFTKHHITTNMAEEPFIDKNLLTFPDPTHSLQEKRFNLLGATYNGTLLHITYTIRSNTIRIISARKADQKERKVYESQKN